MLRPSSFFARSALVSIAVIALAGCSSDGDDSSTASSTVNTDATTTVVTQPLLPALPKDQTVDLQVNHPNGTVARWTNASFKEDHIAITLDVTNGGEREVLLNSSEDAVIRDSQGGTYFLSPPPSNTRLAVPAKATQKYQLVFLGRIHPQAQSINLSINDRFGSSDNRFSANPTFRLGPVPVQR